MLGSRALYHDGWKAVVFHPLPFIAYDGSDPSRPFDDDVWELYHVAEDFSETVDLAASQPEKLAEMVELWWSEAAAHQVLPLNNQPGRFGDPRIRRERYEYRSGIVGLPEAVAPNLRNRALRITRRARRRAPRASSSRTAGRRAATSCTSRTAASTTPTTCSASASPPSTADEALPPGPVRVTVAFTPTGNHRGDIELRYDDRPVGRGSIERMVPITYGMTGFDVGRQRGAPVLREFPVPFAMPPGRARRGGRRGRRPARQDAAAQQRAGMAAQ